MMSEKQPQFEYQPLTHNIEPHHEKSRDINNNKIIEKHESDKQKVEKIRQSIEQHAKAKAEHTLNGHNQETNSSPDYHRHYVTNKIKLQKYKATLGETRKSLSKPGKILSNIIHQPIIESVSEISAKTIAKPSGILAGGFICFFASTLLIFFAKNIGFEVPASAFIALFIGGFLVGIVIEFIWSIFVKRRYGKQNGLRY